MMKKILFLFLAITFTQGLWSQGITKHGEVPASSVNFVDKKGEPGSTAKLSVNGKELNVGFLCGDPITINHSLANHVAPVTKTVTYGTTTTSVFGTSKCIITKNLGATNQAASPSDASEEAAGWYWQYNKKQGFKHDGSTLTPTIWTGGVVPPGLDWLPQQDPCKIELGSEWRIPVKSEWDNAIACDAWGGTSNTYFQGLKIHNNGRVDASGNLVNRGLVGSLWSASNSSSSSVWALWVTIYSCNTTSVTTYDGCGIRCIKDCAPPQAPTGTINQYFYPGQKVSDLKVDGENIKWYSYSTGCNQLANNTALVNGTDYFASQTVGDCESEERLKVTATLFNCGSNFTIEHKTSGEVAPENRSITYSTVWTLLFGENKCAITKNLGAVNQAISSTDPVALAAGWYWQFNRKQGYMHDGTSRTPNTAWDITKDYSSTSWESENDPCFLELGSGWRIPTSSEWTTAAGNWSSYQNAYNSALKLHTAGYLTATAGALSSRGVSGYYWSQNQSEDVLGYNLFINNASSLVNSNDKSNAYPLRCIRNCEPPAAPEGPAFHVFYPGETVATLSATGTAIQWYAAASGGAPLPSTTPLVNGTHYYASQTINCESISRLDVTATLSNCNISGLTINHLVSGGVAPVNKTVHYGSVKTTMFGGDPKCVITQNLGATYQAGSAYTSSEDAAGWYWQFNRKQGYKHDGTTRTPNSAWITNIDEYSDWSASNDPCTIELGSGWRIPTKMEWDNVDAQGWHGLSYTYGSVLKLHAAGFLANASGNLAYRGSTGMVGSSNQYSNTFTWDLYFETNGCALEMLDKENGASLRCIRDCPPPAAPTGNAFQFFMEGQTIAILSATGEGIKWYNTASGGTALTPTTVLANGTHYYASQTIDCESVLRLDVTALLSPCESSTITINHATTGGVAPVNKTVTYNTIPTLLFGEKRCAITQNLGAANEATTPSDATEASAGWYWQFNRKQGYKHDGTVRTPNTSWISSINEESDWTPANDPCSLELGEGWYIPTKSEWTNADGAGGNWGNYTHTFNSGLKLHTSGQIGFGSLYSRGIAGFSWSSTGYIPMRSWYLYFNSGTSYVSDEVKWSGYTVRCIRECTPPAAPTGRSIQWFYSGETLAILVATGSNIQWYATASGGTPLASTTVLVDATTYYASQTVNDCESAERLAVTASQIQSACSGATLAITHQTSGGVAPVNKPVTYKTIDTPLFGKNKCAITQNLGASNEAASVTDATEAAAGWYWQFNRKQGYKHDGTTRTPNTTWISDINESGGWQSANDPCSLELGSGWRIPSLSEWNNAKAAGNWVNWNTAYASPLKLHAAGKLNNGDGTLSSRGAWGFVWSTSNYGDNFGYAAEIFSFGCSYAASYKSTGFPIRCIKDCTPAPAPTGQATQLFFRGHTLANLIVTGNDVKWYASASGGAPLATTTLLVDSTHYFASQNTGGCEGTDRLDVMAVLSACETSSITVAHAASGGVAPVDKSVSYNLVATELFGGFKCAITKNLGATSEASTAYDATEGAAGWYWQFNRKQGFKHDGATRTPNTTWITTINESSDWQASNDPCRIELGTGWRIPTVTELTHADGTGGNWANVTQAFGSALKLHTAGQIDNGALNNRGVNGYLWGSTSSTATTASYLFCSSGASNIGIGGKTAGNSVRCLKDCITPSAPTGQTNQYFYSGQTVANLTVSGSSIRWYSSVNGGTPLVSTTPLADSTHYYASQTVIECESAERLEVFAIQLPCEGTSFTKNHLAAGGVAPVDKSVTYNTVSTTLFGGYKCALIQNLGATNQAASATDATEASAGWYWPFNRKQGFKHDGTTRTPNTAWISVIDEATDWLPENDPCILELGPNWRIPTISEWINADNAGGWSNLNGAFGSVLKLHAAGYIALGSLSGRGSSGLIWSSTRYNDLQGKYFLVNNIYSEPNFGPKANANSIRCIKD